MNTSRIAINYNRNQLRSSDLIFLRVLSSRQQRIVSLIEKIAVYGDTSYRTERELRDEVKAETGLRWSTDVEDFIEDKLSVDLPYWVRRWASNLHIETRSEEPRFEIRVDGRDVTNYQRARVQVSAEVSTRETLAIAQALANLMNAGR
jgi:type II secretory ATPase GspE/PulE/Tfp pilus assembly ATPase PilB-like protein